MPVRLASEPLLTKIEEADREAKGEDVPPARLELTTPGLGILCSILLSYGGV